MAITKAPAPGYSAGMVALVVAIFTFAPAEESQAAPQHGAEATHPTNPEAGGATAQSADQELWLAVQINRSGPAEPVLLLKLTDGRLLMRSEDLKRWRLQLPATAVRASGSDTYYALDELPGLTYTVDEAQQALFIDVPAGLFGSTTVNGRAAQFGTPPAPPLGAFFNYDISAQHGGGGNTASGLFGLGVFNSWGVATAEFVARSFGAGPNPVRLDTTWTQDRPAQMASLRIGDSTSAPGEWGRSVRFGGVQWASDFATQPGFIAFPLPQFSGSTALPSTVDLFVDNALRMRRDVPPGPFSILDLPVVTGSGVASIVVRDVLGREQVISVPYYASPRLLQDGLNAYSYEAGFERENYATASNDYGRFAAAGTQRHGFSDWFTGEAHVELQREQQTAGVNGALLLPAAGVFNASLAVSHAAIGDGGLVAFGFERQTGQLSFGGRVQLASQLFTQLGIERGTLAPRQVSQAYASFATSRFGTFSASYANEANRSREPVKVATASYSVSVRGLGFLSFSAMHTLGTLSGTTYNLMFTRPLDQRTSASVNFAHETAGNLATLDVQRNLPPGDGYGYRIQAQAGELARVDATLALQNGVGTYLLEASRLQGQTSARGDVAGGIVMFGGDTFVSRRIDQSFGVIEVPGYANVQVYADNQPVARTNANGNALVPALRPYQDNEIRIEQADLPLDAEIDTLQLKAVPFLRSGVLVTFPVRRSRGAVLSIVLENGEPLPPGAVVQIAGQSTWFPTGNGGEAYVAGLSASNQLDVTWRNQHCALMVLFPPTEEPLPRLGPYLCAGVKQ